MTKVEKQEEVKCGPITSSLLNYSDWALQKKVMSWVMLFVKKLKERVQITKENPDQTKHREEQRKQMQLIKEAADEKRRNKGKKVKPTIIIGYPMLTVAMMQTAEEKILQLMQIEINIMHFDQRML